MEQSLLNVLISAMRGKLIVDIFVTGPSFTAHSFLRKHQLNTSAVDLFNSTRQDHRAQRSSYKSY